MCTIETETEYEVRVSRPFYPFTSKKDVKTKEIDPGDESSEVPKFTLILAGEMPEYMEQ